MKLRRKSDIFGRRVRRFHLERLGKDQNSQRAKYLESYEFTWDNVNKTDVQKKIVHI